MKLITILGAGESGIGAAILAQKKGFEVFVSDIGTIKPQYRSVLDDYNIEFEENEHTLKRILASCEVVKSPGIPDKTPVVRRIQEKGIPIISEIEFAGRYTNAKMICITGTNGKTTTTMLTYNILKNAGLKVGLAGNVGKSLARQVACCNNDFYVVELSSFQLDGMMNFKANIAVLLNITPDHLERYDYNFQSYVDSKFRIIQNQRKKDAFIFWENDPVIKAEMAKRKVNATLYPFSLHETETSSSFIQNGQLIIKTINTTFNMNISEMALRGIHNTYNTMASALSASILEVKKETIRESLQSFQGVEHRLEYVATVRDIRFVNDSKATNVNSCWYALQSMTTPVVLILGGTDKGNDYSEIRAMIFEKVRALVFLGLDNSKLHAFFDSSGKLIVDTRCMKDAVEAAYNSAFEGDTVLLSPCCASYDLFVSYEDRGIQFKRCVKNL
jgi:UDP-N-acetylmuramoylalanine--D-glutamate ligase